MTEQTDAAEGLRVGASVLVGSLGVTGTITGIDDKPPTRGLSVRLHRPVARRVVRGHEPLFVPVAVLPP